MESVRLFILRDIYTTELVTRPISMQHDSESSTGCMWTKI